MEKNYREIIINTFKEFEKAISQTQRAFEDLGKAIRQFQNSNPTKYVKLKRKLIEFLLNILKKIKNVNTR